MEYDKRHGGPYDRGSAAAYYGREDERPHYYKGATYQRERVEEKDMTPEEVKAYLAGFMQETGRKDWGSDDE